MYKKLALLIGITAFSAFTSFAQQSHKNSVEVNTQIAVSTFSYNYKLFGQAYGGEIILHLNKEDNQAPWMRAINLKSIDIIYNYKRMNDIKLEVYPYNGLFADSHAILAGLNVPLVQVKKVELLFSPAIGVNYVGDTFFTNQNPVISSHLNFALRAGLKLNAPISQTMKVSTGIDIYHYSNGAYRVANNGMNVVSYGVGLSKTIGDNVAAPEHESKLPSDEKHNIELGVDVGRRGIFRTKRGIFRTGAYLGYSYRINDLLSVASGFDGVYYHTVFDPNNYLNTHQSYGSSYDRIRLGLGIGGDIWMGRLSAMFRSGYYLHYHSFTDTKTYWTAGLRYRINKWAGLQGKIYLHGTEADYLGFGLVFNAGILKSKNKPGKK